MKVKIDVIGRGIAYVRRNLAGEDVSPICGGLLARRSRPDGGWQGERLVAVSPKEEGPGYLICGIKPVGTGRRIVSIPVATLVDGDFSGLGIYEVAWEDREIPQEYEVLAPKGFGEFERTLKKL